MNYRCSVNVKVHFISEKKEVDKPERPPKPEMLTHGSGHHRTASEGNIIDYGKVYHKYFMSFTQ